MFTFEQAHAHISDDTSELTPPLQSGIALTSSPNNQHKQKEQTQAHTPTSKSNHVPSPRHTNSNPKHDSAAAATSQGKLPSPQHSIETIPHRQGPSVARRSPAEPISVGDEAHAYSKPISRGDGTNMEPKPRKRDQLKNRIALLINSTDKIENNRKSVRCPGEEVNQSEAARCLVPDPSDVAKINNYLTHMMFW